MLPLRKSPLIVPTRPSARRRILARPAIIIPRAHLPGLMPTWAGQLAPPVVPGSAQWTSAGTFSLLVPLYNVFNLDLRAGGGGGGGHLNAGGGSGGSGGDTYINLPGLTVIAYGGTGGQSPGSIGQGGHGSPGSGANGTVVNGGGAAGGNGGSYVGSQGGNGGAGGRVYRTFTLGESGAPVPNNSYTVVVGSGGSPGPSTSNLGPGQWGSVGAAYFSWS